MSMSTLEQLIDNLDDRGLLVVQVLLGQQSMKLLSKKHVDQVTKPKVLKPSAESYSSNILEC